MKRLSIIALMAGTFGVVSCDMDLMPYDSIPTEKALTTIVGFEEARTGIYSAYTGLAGEVTCLCRKSRRTPLMQWRTFPISTVRYTAGCLKHPFQHRSIWANCYSRYRTCEFLYSVGVTENRGESGHGTDGRAEAAD